MKTYNSIPFWKKGHFGKACIGFDKLDGSNIRAEWSRKKYKKGHEDLGWYKFGTRRQMMDRTHDQFGNAIDVFLNKYAEDLVRVFCDNKNYSKIESVTIFGEYVGENSFAGLHPDPEDAMDFILFDVNPYKKGIISPFEFIDNFGHLHIPEIVYEGNYNKQLVYDVRDGKYDVKEGLIVRGLTKKNQLWMCKLKTREYSKAADYRTEESELIDELINLRNN